MTKIRISTVLVAALFMMTVLSGFTTYDGIGTVSSESNQKIAAGTSYTSLVGSNSFAGGIVSVRVINADVKSGVIKPYVYNGLVSKTYTVSSMANIVSNEGYKVVAGINGDIYDTSSGTPKGAVIHDGILYTGGYQTGYVLSFDQNGAGNVSTQKIYYTMNYQKYETTTVTPEVINSDQTPSDNTNLESDMTDANGASEVTANPVSKETQPYSETKIVDATTSIGYFNVPQGGANALHLYNSRYADNTKTSGTSAEAVLTIKEGSTSDLKIGGTIEATVASVNPTTKATSIASNQLVLSTKQGSATYNDICSMVPGSDVTIKVTTDEGSPLSYAKEAMGVYNVLALNGTTWTTDTTLNPRTCIGLKADGTVVLYVVDGRQSSVSKGMNAVDVASYLLSQGCISAVNMDGGGSTTMVVRNEPGISDKAEAVNSPSDGSLRSVTNGLFLVYTNVDSGEASSVAVYPANSLIMPGLTVQLSAYGINSLYEKASLPAAVSYSSDAVYGQVDANGLFTSNGTAGTAIITAQSGGISGQTKVEIVNDITFSINKASLTVAPGETFDFDISNVLYGVSQVQHKDSLFSWSCPAEIGTIDENGLYTATENKGTYTGNINVKYGTKSVDIPVTVQYTPPAAGFTDVEGHWAKEFILNLSDEGIITGMTETTFEPDSNLTRAQFLTLLSKIDGGENLDVPATSTFTDATVADWYYKAVNWGVTHGIVKGMGDGTFAPNSKVSREQMCVMICNYYAYKNMTWDEAEKDLTFSDKNLVDDWAGASVKKVVSEGIMSGRPDGRFDPLGNATRGEAAKIIYLVKEILAFQIDN